MLINTLYESVSAAESLAARIETVRSLSAGSEGQSLPPSDGSETDPVESDVNREQCLALLGNYVAAAQALASVLPMVHASLGLSDGSGEPDLDAADAATNQRSGRRWWGSRVTRKTSKSDLGVRSDLLIRSESPDAFNMSLLPVKHQLNLSQATVRLGRLLGRGGSAAVYTGSCEGFSVAVKVYSTQELDAKLRANLEAQLHLSVSLQHPSIVRMLDADTRADADFRLYMERASHSLRDELADARDAHTFVPVGRCIASLASLASALTFLHNRRVPLLHRDIKSENVLVLPQAGPGPTHGHLDSMPPSRPGTYDQFVLGDLDEVLPLRPNPTGTIAMNVGTLEFMAPEVIGDRPTVDAADSPYGLPADVWSFGMVIFELLTNHLPYEVETTTAFERRNVILSGKLPDMPRENMVAFLGEGPAGPVVRQLLSLHHKCSRIEARRRPVADRLVRLVDRMRGEADDMTVSGEDLLQPLPRGLSSPSASRQSRDDQTPTPPPTGPQAPAEPAPRRPFSLRSFA